MISHLNGGGKGLWSRRYYLLLLARPLKAEAEPPERCEGQQCPLPSWPSSEQGWDFSTGCVPAARMLFP